MAETHTDSTVQHLAPGIRHIYRLAFGTYRSQFLKVTVAALIVFGSLSMLDTLIDLWAGDVGDDLGGTTGGLVSLLLLFSSSAVVFGSAFYAGLLDHVVGEHQHGHERRPVLHVLRTLPYGRLIAASVLLSVIVSAGLALFVLPGVILFTLFALVGPLINIENRTVLGAFKRSAQLIWPHFWLALIAVTLFVGLEEGTHHAVEEFIHKRHSLIVSFVLGGAFAATFGAVVGLVEVTLAYELVEEDVPRERVTTHGVAASA